MAAGGADGIQQRKTLGMGNKIGGGDSFGVKSFGEMNGGGRSMGSHETEGTKYGEQSKLLGDGERAAGKHVERGPGMMPATRHSDHGPHYHEGDGFGVDSFSSVNR
jgi:hypothetical protein